MSAHQALDAALVLGLELVVEFLGDALAHLAGHRLGIEAGREPLDQRQQQHRVAQIGLDRLGDPGILNLDRDRLARERGGAMDLADRRGREGTLVEIGEHRCNGSPSSWRRSFSSRANGHGRHAVAQRRERALQLIALLVLEAVEIDHRDHLADLHGRAAHPAQLLDKLAHERGRALALGRRGPLWRPHAIGGPHPGPAHALTGHQAADPGRPRHPAGRQLGRLRPVLGLGGMDRG